eukprot:150143-Chlamydomonas_euryale.AAC.2
MLAAPAPPDTTAFDLPPSLAISPPLLPPTRPSLRYVLLLPLPGASTASALAPLINMPDTFPTPPPMPRFLHNQADSPLPAVPDMQVP